MSAILKKIIKRLSVLILLVFLLIFGANYLVESNAESKTYNEVQNIPKNRVGLLLGTVKFLFNGQVNLYYKYRLQSAIELYENGKIDLILVSGDNSKEGYDEPTVFKEDLVNAGIPDDKIVLDYAGFRTLDSVLRSKEVFGQSSITIISQKFHNERAIYLAEHFNIKAIGFNSKGVSRRYGIRVQFREYLARVKVFVDVLIGVQPKFLGEKIQI